MSEAVGERLVDTAVVGTAGPGVVALWVRALADTSAEEVAGLEDADLVDLLRTLEELKGAAEGVQAVAAVALDRSVRAQEERRGLPRARCGRGVAAQVALARRESHARGRRHLGLASVLTAEMPATLAALRAGRITQWRAMLLARETACLSRDDRGLVDIELAGDPERLEGMGDAEAAAAARRLAVQLDAAAMVKRRARAESERRVSLRPAPDTMSMLSVLLPVKDGVAVFATLDRQADLLIAAGDGRSRDQIRTDTLVDRVLGRSRPTVASATGSWRTPSADTAARDGSSTAAAGGAGHGGSGASPGAASPGAGAPGAAASGAPPPSAPSPGAPCDVVVAGVRSGAAVPIRLDTAEPVPAGTACPTGPGPVTDAERGGPTGRSVAVSGLQVLLHVVVSDRVLLGLSDEAGQLDGYGPVPAELVRELAAEQAWVRRLYARPATGELVAADSRARRFPARLAQLVRLRDQRCRTPWCDAPVRHIDHPRAVGSGGVTSLDNGQGLCEACNYAKQAPGWAARPVPGVRHTIRTVTPTGHVHSSTAPRLASAVGLRDRGESAATAFVGSS